MLVVGSVNGITVTERIRAPLRGQGTHLCPWPVLMPNQPSQIVHPRRIDTFLNSLLSPPFISSLLFCVCVWGGGGGYGKASKRGLVSIPLEG